MKVKKKMTPSMKNNCGKIKRGRKQGRKTQKSEKVKKRKGTKK